MRRPLSHVLLALLAIVLSVSLANSQTSDQDERTRLNQRITELYKLGKYGEALPLARRALEIEKATGLEPGVVLALANLGELYLALKKNADAEATFQEALSILDKRQQLDPPLRSVLLERLAQLSFHKRNFEQAIGLLERSLAIREERFGRESKRVAETLHEIANVHRFARRYEKAEQLYLRSIEIMEKIAGRKDPDTISIMKDYACLGFREVRVISVKEEDEEEPSEEEKAKLAIESRARCWLFGFEPNCENKTYTRKSITVLNGKAIKLAQPPYPLEARAVGASGRIVIAVRIDIDGRVMEARPVCGGHPKLVPPSLEAARASRFTPTLKDGKPTVVSGVIVYNFVSN